MRFRIKRYKIDDVINIAKGMPKLWASSKKILWVCWASVKTIGVKIFELWNEFKYGNVDPPQPKIGFWLIKCIADFHISNLGECIKTSKIYEIFDIRLLPWEIICNVKLLVFVKGEIK